MNWFNVIEIIARIISGAVVICFFLGLFLHEKHKVFDDIFVCSGFVSIMAGVTKLLVYAVFGGE